ncbi:hypothetical protein JCGZ_10694 [Jatropha curcas]|uniref:Bet v I/Major latex protein domain-containing protein n=1 Tax=Jatropha curcas TaxID=180498 RepID=A0A067KSA9_JATCU|nr:hypothetical protein JCGZ_10694 [Jatropha curcas]
MTVSVLEHKLATPIPAAKLFKAIVTDGHSVLPKTLPQVFKNFEILEGNGGPGTIRKITYAEGSGLKYVRDRIDKIDPQNFVYHMTTLGGEPWPETLDKVCYELKIEASPDGGSVYSGVMKLYSKGNAKIPDETIKAEEGKTLGIIKAMEQSILANPEACELNVQN